MTTHPYPLQCTVTDPQREVERIINAARHERRGGWGAYERRKGDIAALGLTPDEYESAVRRLANALNV